MPPIKLNIGQPYDGEIPEMPKERLTGRRQGSYIRIKSLAFRALTIIMLLGRPMSTWADMRKISDKGLSEVTAQSGVSLSLSGSSALVDISTIAISEADQPQDCVVFQDVRFRDGSGNPFGFDTPLGNPISFDIGANGSDEGIMIMNLSHLTEPLWVSTSNVLFRGTAIGSMSIDQVVQSPYLVMLQQRAAGDSGFNFEAHEKIDIGGIIYDYNSAGGSFELQGIHLCGTATGNPEDPATWGFTGYFQEGDLATNPATYDAGTDLSGNTAILINSSASGSFRIEDLNMGTGSFGPCAVDGIQVHRLTSIMRP